ncbi:hypothetical protein Lfu02_78770 [Longispora fulva]|uniref:Immunity protein Imm1 n=1 Tax=Longispora fulva TaxID=619741 RepID=A0A8J7G5C8_9ACTN|nr:Imm1 family immunity protein [Longispora fulva]MBG6133968.1 hypothetical protein [Longispora fulva]GIG63505.1 hypothetical protein Lfu02_78770 [Longispora fulva]
MTTRYWMFSDAWVGGEVQQDLAEALETLDSYQTRVNLDGRRAFTIWIGPVPADWDDHQTVQRADAQLRIELDHDQHRIAVTWLPDGTHVIDSEPTGEFTVVDPFQDAPAAVVPAERTVASLDAARRALAGYITTGTKPADMVWA